MKATIDIPDDLYRQVKSKSAMQGLRVREVAVHLFRSWIGEPDIAQPENPAAGTRPPTPSWFGMARPYAQRVGRHDMATIRRSIATGRMHEAKGAATDRGVAS